MNEFAQNYPAVMACIYVVGFCFALSVCLKIGTWIDDRLKVQQNRIEHLKHRSEALEIRVAKRESLLGKMLLKSSLMQEQARRAGIKAKLENAPFEALQMCPFCDHIDYHHMQSRGTQVVNRECTNCGKEWQNLA